MSEVRSTPAAPSAKQSWLPIAGAIGLAVVVGLGLLGSYAIVLYKLRSSPAGREARAQILQSAQLERLLGEPLHAKIEAGDLQHEGRAAFTMRVKGSKATAMVEMDSRAENHRWHIVGGTITLADGTEQPLEPGEPALLARADGGPEPALGEASRLAPDAGPEHLEARGPQP